MSKAFDKLLDHDYDGIKEYDNPLPGWWKWLWILTILFSFVYFPFYHIYGAPGVLARYDQDVAEYEAQQPPEIMTASGEALLAMVGDPTRIGSGQAIFEKNCVACHTADGGGLIGPNLCDNYWKNSNGSIDGIMHTVRKGVLEKGMLAWENILKPEELENVVAFVYTLRDTTPANPKAPEGELYDPVSHTAPADSLVEDASIADPAAEQNP
ncbi:MAG: c-type cytochrome [Candidatus Delongbacteria bacterium]|nr:c-type cytochrome [Candidatus Cloacimonadota bacterium]MCA9786729.1 c-type cytochrome [Candidatus Cloacimonadota bacterium]MCB9473594.1 c-type cytochrome [Candidatus Delongbacteria bacterium]